MKKKILNIVTIIAFGFGANAQNVNIPDANFKAYLVGNSSINTNADAEIQVSEASAFSGQVNCVSLSISDLTGIEAFINLTELYCHTNSLTSLNVSQNTVLTKLFCGENQIVDLDLSNNVALDTLNCWGNQLADLDVSLNTSLTIVSCGDNVLTSLNVANGNNSNFTLFNATSNPNLTCIEVDDVLWSMANWLAPSNIDNGASFSIGCDCTVTIPDANFKSYLVGNTAININGDTEIQCSEASTFTGIIDCNYNNIADLTGIESFVALTELICSFNSLTSLDVTQNPELTLLRCNDNSISSIDISQNLVLTSINFKENDFTDLDFSLHPLIHTVNCNNNSLISLNVANGNNVNFLGGAFFNVTNNPNLTCIQVDDVAYSTTNWTNIDAASSFSLNCNGGVGINELDSDKIVLYPNPTSSQITIHSENKIEQVKVFSSIGSLVRTEYSESFSVENLPTGIYVMNIVTNNGIIRSRFVKD